MLLIMQRFCSGNLTGKVKSTKNPLGSQPKLTADKMPCLVKGLSSTDILNLKASDSSHYCHLSLHSVGTLSLSRSDSITSLAVLLSSAVFLRAKLAQPGDDSAPNR